MVCKFIWYLFIPPYPLYEFQNWMVKYKPKNHKTEHLKQRDQLYKNPQEEKTCFLTSRKFLESGNLGLLNRSKLPSAILPKTPPNTKYTNSQG